MDPRGSADCRAARRKQMWWLRACSRCGGDLVDGDVGPEPDVACLQCGKVLTYEEEAALRTAGRRCGVMAAAYQPLSRLCSPPRVVVTLRPAASGLGKPSGTGENLAAWTRCP